MLLCINFATGKGEGRDFRPWQKLQTQTAYLFGADKVREYSLKDIDPDFYEKNKFIFDQKRGAGYWLWKPYIIKDALSTVEDGDYVFYVDSGAFYINDIKLLIDAMESTKTNVGCFRFGKGLLEKTWTKRDAFILMDCDEEKYTNTGQGIASYLFFKKSADSVALVDKWLEYVQDPRIVTDMPNQLGKENYEGFRENRHDQTVWSLLTKKKNIKPLNNSLRGGGILSSSWQFVPGDVYTLASVLYLHSFTYTKQRTYSRRISIQFAKSFSRRSGLFGRRVY